MSTSTALANFQSALESAIALHSLETTVSPEDPPRAEKQALVSGLRGGAAVLMVAAFESFLEDVIVERLTLIADGPRLGPGIDRPAVMLVESAIRTLKKALQEEGSKSERLGFLRSAARRVLDGVLAVDLLSESQSNPNGVVVDQLFAKLGISGVLIGASSSYAARLGRPLPTSFARDKLTEIVNRRHRVAHTGRALDIAKADLVEASDFLLFLALHLDRVLARLVDRILKRTSSVHVPDATSDLDAGLEVAGPLLAQLF